jgi:hypothetical protein
MSSSIAPSERRAQQGHALPLRTPRGYIVPMSMTTRFPRRSLALAASSAALAALAASAPAAAQMVPITWDGAGRFTTDAAVPAGRFVEMCEQLSHGARVRWRYEAAAPLDFNVHFHAGRSVTYPTQIQGAAHADGALQAASDQEYCWMWTNQATKDVSLHVELQRQ